MLFEGKDPPVRLLVAFQEAYSITQPEWVVQAPGRELWIAAARCEREYYSVYAPDLAARTTFTSRSARNRHTRMRRPLPDWSRYLAGVVVRLHDNGLAPTGLHAVIAGDEPKGPRYHYAAGMAFATLWYRLNNRTYNADDITTIVERVRRDYVEA